MSPTMFFGRVVLPALGLAVAAGLTWNSVKNTTVPTEAASRVTFSAVAVHSSGRITAEGRVVAYPGAEVTVGTEVLGMIVDMPAFENAAVRKGDLLVELRADDVKASLREAHFRLIEAEAGLRLLRARSQLDRTFPAPTGTKGPQAADYRAEEQAAANARRDAAKATVERLEAEAVKYRITAPIGGTVISRHADLGETITPGSPLVTIVDLSRLRVEAEVDEYDIAGIVRSAQATITAEGYASAGWRGEIEEVPEAVVGRQTRPDDPGRPTDTRVLRVKVAFREPNPLKLGQHVEVEIARGGKRP
jgi:HlyD family secretion protein